MAQGTPTKVKKRKKSVLKRARRSIVRAAINRANRTRVRTMIKRMRAAIEQGDFVGFQLRFRRGRSGEQV